ncbi:hypothetical protein XVE_3323 [Xanthomonas vesicatoria ATCC 35937]|uniref:Uncharacterized protein n=1 Tax=Xanthomonas vesicatoria ATCC 35937 TaxID=925775 RepID=F0BGE7_9XANT|nr:hypothetical protein XVE_3323 [Xanthomonas vesicatoria ATCC 35937]
MTRLCQKANLFTNTRKQPVDLDKIKVTRVETPTERGQFLHMLRVIRVGDDLQKLLVAVDPATAFRRAGIGTIDAACHAQPRIRRQHGLHLHRVLPACAGPIEIAKCIELTQCAFQGDPRGMLEPRAIRHIQPGLAVAPAANIELVRVHTAPTHHRLQYAMQGRQPHCASHQCTAPYQRRTARQCDVQLVNRHRGLHCLLGGLLFCLGHDDSIAEIRCQYGVDGTHASMHLQYDCRQNAADIGSPGSAFI